MKNFRSRPNALVILPAVLAAILVGAASAVLGVCGPFTDVSDAVFCPFVLEIFTLGITTGTTPTTYAPTDNVACSDGLHFWVVLSFFNQAVPGHLARF